MPRGYRSMFVRTREHRCLGCCPAWLEGIVFAVQRHGRGRDLRLFPKARLETLVDWVPRRQTEIETIGMDDDINEVGIVE